MCVGKGQFGKHCWVLRPKLICLHSDNLIHPSKWCSQSALLYSSPGDERKIVELEFLCMKGGGWFRRTQPAILLADSWFWIFLFVSMLGTLVFVGSKKEILEVSTSSFLLFSTFPLIASVGRLKSHWQSDGLKAPPAVRSWSSFWNVLSAGGWF